MASSSMSPGPRDTGVFQNLPALVPVPLASETSSPMQTNRPPMTEHVSYSPLAPAPLPTPIDANRTAMMHPQAGLVVSLNMNYIPRVVKHPLLSNNQRPIPYTAPRLVPDSEVYLAFLPTYAMNTGALFGRLNLTDTDLDSHVGMFTNGRYGLDPDLAASWSRLEEAMLDATNCLLVARPNIPSVEYPELPSHKGYHNAHTSRSAAVSCARRSRDQFVLLSALLTFAIALHLEDDVDLQPAYAALRGEQSRRHSSMSKPWWDLLCDTYVCNFNLHFRIGAMVDARTTLWMPYIKKFALARVPFWLLWGNPSSIPTSLHPVALQYLPPPNFIDQARDRMLQASTIVLPTYRFDPFAVLQAPPLPSSSTADTMDASGPEWAVPATYQTAEDNGPRATSSEPPHAGNAASTSLASTSSASISSSAGDAPAAESTDYDARKAKALDDLQKTLDDLSSRREAHIARESLSARQSREGWEAEARRTNSWTNKCLMYTWQLVGDAYVAEKVNKKQYEVEWASHTPNQRRYTPHLNRWDLCDGFPDYTRENPRSADYEADLEVDACADADDADADADDVGLPYGPQGSNDDPYVLDSPPTSVPTTVNFVNVFDTLSDRFGWDIRAPSNWGLPPSPNLYRQSRIGLILGFTDSVQLPAGIPQAEFYSALDRLIKTIINGTSRYVDLPIAFDYAHERLTLDDAPLKVIMVGKLYVIQPKVCSVMPPWVISTPHAATVLLVYRRKVYSMEEIARELARRGARFGTVRLHTSTRPKYPIPFPSRGLGLQPGGFRPLQEDYNEYLRRLEDLLKGYRGRAALMHGGLVSRIARDVVDVGEVLKGPSIHAVAVAAEAPHVLEDDALSQNDLDIICGVYYIRNNTSSNDRETFMYSSWWPRSPYWEDNAGFNPVEWTEVAEKFYQGILAKRSTDIRSTLLNTSQWRSEIRKQNTIMKKLLHNNEILQNDFLQGRLRATNIL